MTSGKRLSEALRRFAHPAPSSPNEEPQSPPLDAAEAWKAVGLVNDWVKHAETKAATTLAAAGVVGGVLYNLIKDQTHPSALLAVAATVCGILVIASAFCGAVALWPRLRSRETATSTLYFDHIARRHPKSPTAYIQELRSLLAAPDELVSQLGQQVWAHARVARRKYRWAGWALIFLVGASGFLGITATRLALTSIGVGSG